MAFFRAILVLALWWPSSKAHPDLRFSVGFTDDAVLRRSPAAATVYGLVPSGGSQVRATVHDVSSGAVYTVQATVTADTAVGHQSNPLCQSCCLEGGHCCVGQTSACQKPSCAMGQHTAVLPIQMRCRQPVRLDVIPKLFPGHVALRPAVSKNLPSTQHKLSMNSLQMQPSVSLSASAEDQLTTP